MISSYRFYEMYSACALHFREGSTYDYFKYKGKSRVSEKSFVSVKGKYFYSKAARNLHSEDQALDYLAANFKEGCKWVGNLSPEPVVRFTAYRDAIYYKFESDLNKYSEISPYKEALSGSTDSWNYLILLNEASEGTIFNLYNERYGDDILWDDLYSRLQKFAPFLVYCYGVDDETKANLRAIAKKVREENA